MAKLNHRKKVKKDVRGHFLANGSGAFEVATPKGITNRKIETFHFNFTSVDEACQALTLSGGNDKLNKTAKLYAQQTGNPRPKIMSFNLPALLSCPGALECAHFCYALQGQYFRRQILELRARNMAAAQHLIATGGWELLADALTVLVGEQAARLRSPLVLRPHDSGDFYGRGYFKAWLETMRRLPHVKFYGYTKRIGLYQSLHALGTWPPNFTLVQSVGGVEDQRIDLALPHSKVFSSHEARAAAGYVDGTTSDIPAMTGEVNIGLIYHGTEKLRAA